jgi:hypothetical protein
MMGCDELTSLWKVIMYCSTLLMLGRDARARAEMNSGSSSSADTYSAAALGSSDQVVG